MLLQTPPNWDRAGNLNLGSKDLLIVVLFAAGLLFALAVIFRAWHDHEEKKKAKST